MVQAGSRRLQLKSNAKLRNRGLKVRLLQVRCSQVALKSSIVGPKPDGSDSREVTATPIDNETPLGHYAWIDSNRRKGDQLGLTR